MESTCRWAIRNFGQFHVILTQHTIVTRLNNQPLILGFLSKLLFWKIMEIELMDMISFKQVQNNNEVKSGQEALEKYIELDEEIAQLQVIVHFGMQRQ